MELSELKNFDYLMMIIAGASVYFGWKAGFIESFISFFAWAGSAVIVAESYEYVYLLVNGYIPSSLISGFIASFVFYVALVILILYFGARVSKSVAKFGGGPIDKITGAVFGVLRGVLIAIALFWVCYISSYTLNDQKMPVWLSAAKSYKVLKLGSDSLSAAVASEEEREKMLKLIINKTKDSEKEVKASIDKSITKYNKEDS